MDNQDNKILLTGQLTIAKDVTISDSAMAMVKANVDTEDESLDIDLLTVRFKLVHANKNKNRDEFLTDELLLAEATPINKPINWQHTDRIIGVMTASEFVSTDGADVDEDDHLIVDGVIYQFLFPAYAQEMLERHEDGKLAYSMEVWFTEAECSDCGESFAKSEDYCSCLKNRFSKGSQTSRILKGLTFGGAGVVDHPADEDAVSLSMGEESPELNNSIEEEMTMVINDNGQVVFESQAAFDEAVAKAVQAALEAQQASQDVVDLQAKLDEAEAKIAKLETDMQEALAAKDEEIEAAKAAQVTAEEALANYEAERAADEALASRLADLEKAGIVVPEDEEMAAKIVASIRKMDDEGFENYKETLVATAAKNAASNNNDDSNAQAEVDVPNSSTASTKSKFPMLEKVLGKEDA